jgi:hypothetical protein
MTTRTLDKTGKVIKAPKDTLYHKDGTGPRDAQGAPLRDAGSPEPAPPAAPARRDDASPPPA